jgi:2,3-bisphosphoglycerate-independent phosphoglycerate mutase
MSSFRPVVLLILDGFGLAPSEEGNAIKKAKMPVFQKLVQNYPAMTVQASGAAVGLSWGEMGNSEVGHLTIGAGRVFYQSLPRIDLEIETGRFFENPALVRTREALQQSGGRLHLLGLVSAGNVHASQAHANALLEWAKRSQIKEVFVHAFLDGRDAAYNSGKDFIAELQGKMKELSIGKIASLSGRYFAMDRDNRWDRVQKAYEAIALGVGETATDPMEAIEASYAKQIFDEQFVPTVIQKNGQPVARVEPGDAIVFFNFRPDRARELTKAFVLPAFDKFPRQKIDPLHFVSLTEYEKDLPLDVAYPPYVIENCLARVVSDAGLKQLHIAETEKYAHVTFFLNGMREEAFPHEERVIIPSPAVSTYDLQPEMSVFAVTERIVKETLAKSFDLIVANFANPDMVGHTGNEQATILACEAVDKAIGQISDAILAVGGALVITADHGNAEEVKNLMTGEMDKEHSTNPVPCLIVAASLEGKKASSGDVIGGDLSMTPSSGMLADIAPTVCALLGIAPAADMTGRNLL